MRRFGAPWDRPLLLSTVALLAVILFAAIGGTSAALRADLRGIALAVALFAAGLAIGAWALAPSEFEIGAGRLRILRNGWRPHVVLLADIRAVSPVEPNALRGSIRIFGTGGLFGYYGLFRSPSFGSYRLYATRGTGLVLVRTERRLYVLTPDAPRAFAGALLAASAGAGPERPRPADPRPR